MVFTRFTGGIGCGEVAIMPGRLHSVLLSSAACAHPTVSYIGRSWRDSPQCDPQTSGPLKPTLLKPFSPFLRTGLNSAELASTLAFSRTGLHRGFYHSHFCRLSRPLFMICPCQLAGALRSSHCDWFQGCDEQDGWCNSVSTGGLAAQRQEFSQHWQ